MSDSEIALLGLLAEKPRYGYELDKVIEERGMREWTDIAFSSIYSVLRLMEQKGMVTAAAEVAGNRVRKLFTITKEGKRRLKDDLTTRISEPTTPNDPMMLVLSYLGIVPESDRDQAFSARLLGLEKTKEVLKAKLNKNAKSPANVIKMFERSLAQIDYEIEFASMFKSEVASAPAEPRNDVERIGEVASAPSEPRNDVKRIGEVASAPSEPRNDVKRTEPEKTPDEEVKDTLF